MKMLRSLIQDGCNALLQHRYHSAAQTFTELLNSLDPQKMKQLNLATINYVLVIYGFAISLLGIGQPEELCEAENQFKRMIEHYSSEGLDCLAYCGIGKVYLRKNRFLEALNHFQKAKTLIFRLPGVLTWPTSNVIIEETQPGKIKSLLEKFIEECKFPPVPDAICRCWKCCGYSKIQIYKTDPDFKGFIRISCCQYCKIEFHMNCWKKLKTTTFNDKIDKDFLQEVCFTPDCEGIISKVIIFSSDGQVKRQFEHKVIKEKAPPRPILKQKCSSLGNLTLKEDKKLRRKIQKQEAKKLAQERLEEDLKESNPPKAKEQKDSAQSCQFLEDRILQCIKQYADKIKSGILNTSKFLKELLAWKVLSTEDYATCLSSRNFLKEEVDCVIRHLIQEKNRVKTRIFLHVLSELKEVEPKLATWLQKLNSFASLKEVDFSIMTVLWNEKYGHKVGSIEGKQLDYFCKPTSLKEARCLIWLLEEHREKFPTLQGALDEFFDIMDSPCTVLRRQDSGDVPYNSTKKKNKGKKKKPKDSKPMLVGSGTTSVTQHNKTVTSSDDFNRRSSNSEGPFVVPDHLRQDVEEFEALYERRGGEHVAHNRKLWDINPKQKRSTLYDYFSESLEKHDALDVHNKRVSEEYEFFPEETRQLLGKTGGLTSLFLECPRFVLIDNCIALKKVASRLTKKKKKNMKTEVEEMSKMRDCLRMKVSLDPAAREFKSDVKSKAGSDPAPAPAPEEPQPACDDPPAPACDAVRPRPGAEGPPRPASGEEKPCGVSLKPPNPVSEVVSHQTVSSKSPEPVVRDVKGSYWTQTHLVTGYCAYVSFWVLDLTQAAPAYVNIVSSLHTSIHVPLATIPVEYQLQRPALAMPSSAACGRADRSAAVRFEGRCGNAENDPGSRVATDGQRLRRSVGVSQKSGCGADGADTAQSEPGRLEGHGGSSDYKRAANAENTQEVTASPQTKMVGTQVPRSVMHQEVSTEPCDPFETQVISKTELNWFLQDLEKEIKKWQQEKKEIQEKLKTLKKKMKEVQNAGETNMLASEKMKIEDSIKKGKEQCEESLQRAVAAEVSVLESWTEKEVLKLQAMESQADAYLKSLKRASSESAASPDMESDIHSWESFLSNIKEDIEKVKAPAAESCEMCHEVFKSKHVCVPE